jgi:uncharacterized protein YgbK (DUF1537 family)
MGRKIIFAVVSDDLTGACDSGVQLVHAQYCTAVRFGEGLLPGEVDAVVVDTESRLLPEGLAYQRVAEASMQIRQARVIFKKIDSALRGPIPSELSAIMDVTGFRSAILAPAFPDQGRTTVKGTQLLHGTPVDQTEFSRDPLTPVMESHLPSLLENAGLGPVVTFTIKDLSYPALLQSALEQNRYIVVDAETSKHLESLVHGVLDPSSVLWIGSAGLLKALGKCNPGLGFSPPTSYLSSPLHTLAVIGSSSVISRKQIEYAIHQPGVVAAPLSISDRSVDLANNTSMLKKARQALLAGQPVVIYPVVVDAASIDLERGCKVVDKQQITLTLAEMVSRLAEDNLFDALFLSGGETAFQVARRLAAWGILLTGECETGVPNGFLLGPRSCAVITKAGSFGTDKTLFQCIHTLSKFGGL